MLSLIKKNKNLHISMNVTLNKLGLCKINDFIYNSVNDSIKNFYSINNDIIIYNIYINHLANYYKKNYQFNNKHKLVRVYKKKKRVDTIGYYFKALIKYNNNTYFTNIFMKEVPIIPFNYSILINRKNDKIDYLSSKYSEFLYDYNSCANIEIFVSYLVSKITELNVCPSFCINYGNYIVNMKKFTYRINKNIDTNNFNKNNIYIKNKTKYLQVKNIPIFLLPLEYLDSDFESLYKKNININFLSSILFQIIAAIIIINKTFGIKHNDLHIGNIMFKKTNLKFLYYIIDKQKYRIPTFGYIMKIIDWGRASFIINNLNGTNNSFKSDGDCFGQYILEKIGNSKKTFHNLNRWSDIVFICHNILHNFINVRNSKIYKLLLSIITDSNNNTLDINKFDWNTYILINNLNYNVRPRNIIKNKIFQKYRFNTITTKNKIYDINY